MNAAGKKLENGAENSAAEGQGGNVVSAEESFTRRTISTGESSVGTRGGGEMGVRSHSTIQEPSPWLISST